MRATKTMDYLVVLCMGLNITEVVFPGKGIMNALGLSMGEDYKDINLAFKCISNWASCKGINVRDPGFWDNTTQHYLNPLKCTTLL